MAALVYPKDQDRLYDGLKNKLPAYCKDFDAIVDRINSISSDAGAAKANTISESTVGSGVSITGQLSQGTVNSATTTATLTKAQSGSTFYISKLDGVAYTLPAATAANIGTKFTFQTIASATSGVVSIGTASGSDTFSGAILMKKDATADKLYSSVTAVLISATYTTVVAGLLGTKIHVECIAVGVWAMSGQIAYSGTVSSPLS